MSSCSSNSLLVKNIIKLKDGPVGLSCSDEEAIKTIDSSIKNIYSEHYGKYLKRERDNWGSSYEKIQGKNQFFVIYEAILSSNKKVENNENRDLYYYESIKLLLSKTCDLLDIKYSKDLVELIY